MDRLIEFSGNHPILMIGLMASFFLLVFTEIRRKRQGLTDLGPLDAVRLINNDAVVVDVRNPESYAKGHIVNARNVPADQLERDRLSDVAERPVLLVDDNGLTAGRAASKLRAAGLENVFSLRGGLAAWQQESLPLVTGRKKKKGG
ncbi:MAG TPA: rhodanese-like domain-containing protein [Woeseiaceae bacterium]|nr:rhodanese-like domain-containing protein [Woeseiaceae bacterium]